MAHYCYIIFSARLDKYYVGETADFENRLKMHNIGFSSFTSKANDWTPFHLIECADAETASKIEAHIKSMKSRKYIQNLGRYPEMTKNLLTGFTISPRY